MPKRSDTVAPPRGSASFAVLYLGFDASEALFRTGWFVLSVLTELSMILVIRTRGARFRSRPSTPLMLALAAVAVSTAVLPYAPAGAVFRLVPLPVEILAALVALTVGYVAASEVVKRHFGHHLR